MNRVVNAKEVVTYESPTSDQRRFRILVERDLSGSKAVAAGHTILRPGTSQPGAEAHPETEEIYYCASGRGTLLLDDERYPLEPGTAAYVGPGVLHQLFNTGDEDLVMVWFESPPSTEVGKYKPMELNWKQIPPEK
jgi:mannose-6-phosphate isomerase-like protein (cupin superfamily)